MTAQDDLNADEVDVCVIGSGAGAMPCALTLAQAGLSVLVLEKGGDYSLDETADDELLQTIRDMYRPSGELDPTVLKSAGKTLSSASRIGQGMYLVGGGTVRYAAISWRFRPEDFKKKTVYGSVEGADLADWPVSYEDLEPYYTKAELEIGISGISGADPTEPRRSKDVLLPPLRTDPYAELIKSAAKRLGWTPFPIPMAINSKPNAHTGTLACMYCGWCVGYPCEHYAKNSVDITLLPKAERTGKFRLLKKAYAQKIETNGRGLAERVIYSLGESRAAFSVKARVVVLAASAIQSARLLLLSASGAYPHGLANGSGYVGKNLMFHFEQGCLGVFDRDFPHDLYVKTGIHDFYFPRGGSGFVNHCSIQSGSQLGPIHYATMVGHRRGGVYGGDFVKYLRANYSATQVMLALVEDLPQWENRVGLSETTDAWGVPAPEVHHRYHAMDKAALKSTLEKVSRLQREAGASQILSFAIPEHVSRHNAWHLMGTARMSDDPAAGVLDAFCRAHEVRNLFITDGSCFPTSGGLNPTLTIQANSFRVGDFIAAEMKGGRL